MEEADLLDRLDLPSRQFFMRLFDITAGDESVRVSMYDIGAEMGLERSEATQAAENIMAEGWAEVKTLAGDIGITREGIAVCRSQMGNETASGGAATSLGTDVVLSAGVRQQIEQVTARLKLQAANAGLAFESLSEWVADLRTIDAQLASPRPKTTIIRACLTSILEQMQASGVTDNAATLSRLLE